MKKLMLKTVASSLLFLSLTACKKEIQANDDNEKIYVLSEITAGDSAIVPIGKSIKAASGATITFEKLTVASVMLSESLGTTTKLSWNNSSDFFSNPAAVYTSKRICKSNQTYSLQVNNQGLPTVTATTHIPNPFAVQNVKVDDTEFRGKDVLRFSLSIKDELSEKNYYMFEAVKQLVRLEEYFFWQGVKYNYNTEEGIRVYNQASNNQNIDILKDTIPSLSYLRLNLYTGDLNTENEEFSTSPDSSFHRIFLTDSLFNGLSYSTSFAVDQSFFEAKEPAQKGRILIRVKSVSKELFTYLVLYEKYRSEFGIVPPATLTSPLSNIQNGLGIFGGSYKNEWVYYYDDL